MSDSSWLNNSAEASASNAEPRLQPYELRPLSTGEVLDRTFQLYRSRFWLFALMAAIPAAITGVMTAAQSIYNMHHLDLATQANVVLVWATMVHSPVRIILTILTYVLMLLLYSLLLAATTWVVAQIYLGEPASIGAAIRSLNGRWIRYMLLAIAQFWSGLWLLLAAFALAAALGGIAAATGFMAANKGLTILLMVGVFSLMIAGAVFSVIFYLRVSLCFPASVVENLKVRAAIRRSKALMVTRKFRIFLLYLLIAGLNYALAILFAVPLFIVGFSAASAHHQPNQFALILITHLMSFLVSTLVGPMGTIGLCLFYLDERVRREGFDIEFLMDRSQLPSGDDALPLAGGEILPEST